MGFITNSKSKICLHLKKSSILRLWRHLVIDYDVIAPNCEVCAAKIFVVHFGTHSNE